METLNREDILRMIGLRDAAGLYSKVNSLMIDMYDEGGKLAEYSTQIIQTEKNITLLAQRVTDDETNIADLTVQAQQIAASVSSLTTTVNGHTQSIGQLEITANQVSQRVTVIEGDYVKSAQISLMVTKNEQGYISNALISADNIKFSTFDWTVTNPDTDKTVFHLDSDGNLTIAGTISAINSGNIVMTNDVNFYVNGGKFAKFGSTVSNFEAMLYVRNDGGQCIAAQSFNGGVGLFALGNSGSKAIQAVGPSEFALREGETLKITSMSTSSSFVNTYFAPYSAMRTSSFTLPSNPAEGTMLFCKGKSADLKVTTASHPILHGDSSDVLVETNTTYNFGRNSIFLFFMGSYWGLIYSA